MLKRLFGAGLAALAGVAFAAGASAQTLDKIKSRGVLVVGTKADYKPFGFRDPSGAIVGFEPDIGKEVADKLGVKLELEPVVSSNRMQFLQQGKIDLMIATMNDKPDRRQVVGIIDPLYYASGVNVLASRKAALKTWEQLKGQKVCGIQGAWYNKPVAEKYGADIVAFKARPRPRRRSCRATASPGSMTTPPSPSASPTPSGRTTRCRSRRSSRSPGASP
jgi:polar amino acid transport system substrate-binding protein